MVLMIKTIIATLIIITSLWISSRALAVSRCTNDQFGNPEEPDCIMNDLNTRYVMRTALGRSLSNPKSDLYSLFARVNSQRSLSPIAFDYGDLTRNQVILLDDSIETKTRKRGSLFIPEPTQRSSPRTKKDESMCDDCSTGNWTTTYLGKEFFPHHLSEKICNNNICTGFFKCLPIKYMLHVLKKSESASRDSETEQINLGKHWVTQTINVTIACKCGDPEPDYEY